MRASGARSGSDRALRPWVLATRSAGKLRELRPLFRDAGHRGDRSRRGGSRRSRRPRRRSRRSTPSRRTRWRRRGTSTRCAAVSTSWPTTPGLCVDALGGAPGVRSKRWSGRAGCTRARARRGEQREARLEPGAVWSMRRARFVCAAAWHGEQRRARRARGRSRARSWTRRRARMGSATTRTSSSTSSG